MPTPTMEELAANVENVCRSMKERMNRHAALIGVYGKKIKKLDSRVTALHRLVKRSRLTKEDVKEWT